MDTTPVNSQIPALGATQPSLASRGGAMGKDEFLKLLVAQMSNQDPLAPQQGSEYVAQLAQFSSVEQLIQLNDRIGVQGSSLAGMVDGLDRLRKGQDDLLKGVQGGSNPSLLGATSLIGRDIEATGGHVLLGEGTPTFQVRLGADAAKGTLVIRDEKGNVVRRIDLEARAQGEHEVAWNGQDEDGQRLPDGRYSATVEARDATGEAVQAQTFTRGTVSRVSMTSQGLVAWLGGLALPVSTLTSVSS